MITKKKIKSHILWSVLFGLIGGFIVTYDKFIFVKLYNIHVYKTTFLSYSMQFPSDSASEMWRHFEKYILSLVNLTIVGMFIGITLGIADKSMRKGCYGVIGGLVGAFLFYALQIMNLKISSPPGVEGVVVFALFHLPQGSYAIFIGAFMGLALKSLRKAIFGIGGGMIGAIVVVICMILMFISGLMWSPFMGASGAILSEEVCSIILAMITIVLISTGIFIGTRLGEKKALNENN